MKKLDDIDCRTWGGRIADRVGRVTGWLWFWIWFLGGLAYAMVREFAIWH